MTPLRTRTPTLTCESRLQWTRSSFTQRRSGFGYDADDIEELDILIAAHIRTPRAVLAARQARVEKAGDVLRRLSRESR